MTYILKISLVGTVFSQCTTVLNRLFFFFLSFFAENFPVSELLSETSTGVESAVNSSASRSITPHKIAYNT